MLDALAAAELRGDPFCADRRTGVDEDREDGRRTVDFARRETGLATIFG
jgi:hypothetical protein